MEPHDELTDTGIFRFQRADAQARDQFIGHFLRSTSGAPTGPAGITEIEVAS